MSSIKQLAGQTIWYGLSSIAGRFLNYLLTPLLLHIFASVAYGKISTLFAIAAFLNILFSYGMETAYFRFASREPEEKVFQTAFTALLSSTFVFSFLLLAGSNSIARFLEIPDQPQYVQWVVLIVAFDTLAVLPFSRLRHQGRPRKYAFIKILNILTNIALVLFFLVLCKNAPAESWLQAVYNPAIGLGYVILANVAASALTLLLLLPEWKGYRVGVDMAFLKELLSYSWPLIIVGFGGMINEMIDRFMLLKLYPGGTDAAYAQSGIYSANYKLAVLIVLFIQAFRLGAEPFFFRQSTQSNAPQTYARVMKFFVLACCGCFLGVTLFLDIWKYFMGRTHTEYWTGLKVVPLLMLAKLFLGVYYNLSVWYKLTNRNLTGAWITLGGAGITILINLLFIPKLGYMACAYATLGCYGFMMMASYVLGQRYYPIPYEWKKLSLYVLAVVVLYCIHQILLPLYPQLWYRLLTGALLSLLFVLLVGRTEKNELRALPVFGRWLA